MLLAIKGGQKAFASFSGLDTSIVTVFMFLPPLLYIIQEVIDHLFETTECETDFCFHDVFVVAFTELIVVAQDTIVIHDEGQPVFIVMLTTQQGFC
ncbi:MAG: hypothetical protein R3E95_10765 [Thiolinea sp.]